MVLVIVVVVIDVSFVLTLVEMSLVLVIAFLLYVFYFEKMANLRRTPERNLTNFSQFHHHQIDFEKLHE